MAPAVRQHPGARPIREKLMDKASVAYVLCRIEDDASLTPVSHHQDILAGIAAGGYAVEVEDLEFAYALYARDALRDVCTTLSVVRGWLASGAWERLG